MFIIDMLQLWETESKKESRIVFFYRMYLNNGAFNVKSYSVVSWILVLFLKVEMNLR